MDNIKLEKINFQPHFPIREDGLYAIEEFDALYDRQFIDALYHAILRRSPDADGEAHYLAQLRSGEYKARLLKIFLDSDEAAKFRTKVAGIEARLRWIRLFEMPLIGRLIEGCLFLANLHEHLRDLRVLENHLFRLAEEAQRTNEANFRKLNALIK